MGRKDHPLACRQALDPVLQGEPQQRGLPSGLRIPASRHLLRPPIAPL